MHLSQENLDCPKTDKGRCGGGRLDIMRRETRYASDEVPLISTTVVNLVDGAGSIKKPQTIFKELNDATQFVIKTDANGASCGVIPPAINKGGHEEINTALISTMREAQVLAGNISLYYEGIISKEQLEKIYDGRPLEKLDDDYKKYSKTIEGANWFTVIPVSDEERAQDAKIPVISKIGAPDSTVNSWTLPVDHPASVAKAAGIIFAGGVVAFSASGCARYETPQSLPTQEVDPRTALPVTIDRSNGKDEVYKTELDRVAKMSKEMIPNYKPGSERLEFAIFKGRGGIEWTFCSGGVGEVYVMDFHNNVDGKNESEVIASRLWVQGDKIVYFDAKKVAHVVYYIENDGYHMADNTGEKIIGSGGIKFMELDVVNAQGLEPTFTPDILPTPTNTPTVEPTSTPEATGKYSDVQEKVLLLPEVQDRLAKMAYAVDFWKGLGGPLEGKSVEIKPVFDDLNNPTDATYFVEFKDTNSSYFYTFKNGDFISDPANGMMVLRVPEGMALSVKGGTYAVKDADGELMQVMDTESGNWIMDKGWVEKKFFAGEWPKEEDLPFALDGPDEKGGSLELGEFRGGNGNYNVAYLVLDAAVFQNEGYLIVGSVDKNTGRPFKMAIKTVLDSTYDVLSVTRVEESSGPPLNIFATDSDGKIKFLNANRFVDFCEKHIGTVVLLDMPTATEETPDFSIFGEQAEEVRKLYNDYYTNNYRVITDPFGLGIARSQTEDILLGQGNVGYASRVIFPNN